MVCIEKYNEDIIITCGRLGFVSILREGFIRNKFNLQDILQTVRNRECSIWICMFVVKSGAQYKVCASIRNCKFLTNRRQLP